jgi:hypothetical protein
MEGRTAISTRIAAHLRANVIGYAALLMALTLVPAWANAGSTVDGPKAAASGSIAKQVKKLKRRLASVESQLAALQGESGSPRPPTGAAGGDLTGSYPNPLIAGGAVTSAKVADGSLTGIDVQNGSIAIADLAPAAYGARASGLVGGSGQLTRSENVASVSHPDTGIYCIALELASGINPSTAVLLVGRDTATFPTDQDFSLAQWRSSGANCPAGRLEVDTFVYNGDDIDDDDGGGNTQGDVLFASNQDFTFVVP